MPYRGKVRKSEVPETCVGACPKTAWLRNPLKRVNLMAYNQTLVPVRMLFIPEPSSACPPV